MAAASSNPWNETPARRPGAADFGAGSSGFILADEDEPVDPTIPVPAAVLEAAREAGLTMPGQAPVPPKRTMRMRAPGAPEPAVADDAPQPKPAPAPEPALVPMFPPRRGPEVPRDEASIIVNATPVPPPAPPAAPAPPAPPPPFAPQATPHAFGPSPTPFGAITPSAQSSGAYGALGHAPPPRSRKDDATVMLAPARHEEPSSGKGWIVVVVVVLVLVLAAAGGALVFLRG